MKWGYEFYRHSNKEHVERSIPALKEISLFSKSMYQELAKELPFDFGFHERGLLMLYQLAATEKEEIETAHLANRAGVEAHVLSLMEVQKLEPDVRLQVRGGVYYPGDAHLTPRILMENLIDYLKERGVVFQTNTTVTGFHSEGNVVKIVRTDRGDLETDELVVATGSWSASIPPLQPERARARKAAQETTAGRGSRRDMVLQSG